MVSIAYECPKTLPAIVEIFAREHVQSGNVEPDSNTVRRPSKFTETNVRRALRAARKEGVDVRVEIMPNGQISIIPLTGTCTAPTTKTTEPNDWNTVLSVKRVA
jgi:hypothetical protein